MPEVSASRLQDLEDAERAAWALGNAGLPLREPFGCFFMSIDEDEQGDRFARLCVGDEEHLLPVSPVGIPVLSHHARAMIDYARAFIAKEPIA
jgi:hypothetical protein